MLFEGGLFAGKNFRSLCLLVIVVLALLWGAPRLGGAVGVQAAPVTDWAYSSYIGGGGVDEARAVAVDPTGNIYVLGKTGSSNFLGSGHTISGYSDIFVAKFDPTGSTLLDVTLLGSPDTDDPLAIQVDEQGNVYVTAYTFSDDFPTLNALWNDPPEYWHDAVLFKLNASGSLVYSTYLPLDVFDARNNLAVDASGNAYVTGTSYEDGMSDQIGLFKLSPTGAQVLLERHLGGIDSEKGIALSLDTAGNIYLTGTTSNGEDFPVTAGAHQPVCGDIFYERRFYCFEDAVVLVLNPAGQVTYSSHHGGSFSDKPQSIATDGQGHILLAGNTTSGEFPLVQALQTTCPLDSFAEDCLSPRGFVSLIQVTGGVGSLVYSTYLGSPESESTNVVQAAVMDTSGNATVLGYTSGLNFPLADPIQPELYESFCWTFSSPRYCFDAFITTFSLSGAVSFSTYLGATFDEFPYGMAVGNTGSLFVTGVTEADDFPTTANAYQPTNLLGDDGFLVKVGAADPPPPPVGNFRLYLVFALR